MTQVLCRLFQQQRHRHARFRRRASLRSSCNNNNLPSSTPEFRVVGHGTTIWYVVYFHKSHWPLTAHMLSADLHLDARPIPSTVPLQNQHKFTTGTLRLWCSLDEGWRLQLTGVLLRSKVRPFSLQVCLNHIVLNSSFGTFSEDSATNTFTTCSPWLMSLPLKLPEVKTSSRRRVVVWVVDLLRSPESFISPLIFLLVIENIISYTSDRPSVGHTTISPINPAWFCDLENLKFSDRVHSLSPKLKF